MWPGLRSQIYSSFAWTHQCWRLAGDDVEQGDDDNQDEKGSCSQGTGLVNDKVHDMISGRE